jgi:ribosomal protein L35
LVERIGHQLSEKLKNFERHLIKDNATSKLDYKIVAHMLLDVVNEDEEALNK